MKPFVYLLMSAFAMSVPAAASTQIQPYYHAGVWDAFSGRSSNGAPVCGVGTTTPSDGRRFELRLDLSGTTTVFSASKMDWSIPANTPVTLVMQVGLNTPWTIQATGHDHSMDWTLDPAATQAFDRQFRGASSMTLAFPNGNELPWTLSLAGSTAISDTFGRCVRDLTRQYQTSTPPSGHTPAAGGPTQPFGASTAAPAGQPP